MRSVSSPDGRQHDDRDVARGAQLAADRKPSLPGSMTSSTIRSIAASFSDLAHLAFVARHADAAAIASQESRQQLANFAVVVDDEDVR